ncbi:MAG: hypothetical protein P8Y36_05625, partial [Alphaproteobacteria bacterium]
MLYLLGVLGDQGVVYGFFRVFQYQTFRTGGAIMTALMVVMMFGPSLINQLRISQGKGQPIRSDGPAAHFAKAGTPTMGGLMILLGFGVATILWANLANKLVWVVLSVTLSYGLIGFYDDFLKVTKRNPQGFSGNARLLFELIIAALAAYFIIRIASPSSLPLKEDLFVNLTPTFLLLATYVIAKMDRGNLNETTLGFSVAAIMIIRRAFYFGIGLTMILAPVITNTSMWVVFALLVGYGAIDLIAMTRKEAEKATKIARIVIELVIVCLAAYTIMVMGKYGDTTWLSVPFFKDVRIPLGPFFI